MANPDFVDESVADQGGAGPFTVLFPSAWAANQIALIFISTDGWIPTLTTANGFAIATDVNGTVASVTTNAGTAGAAECGMFVFWKRLVGSTSGTDPAPTIGAAPGGSTMAIELNTYSGCRTSGNPFHIIATGTAASSSSITSPSVTPTLNACTLVTAAASANDDQAFNNWTFSGSASPAGTLDSGWHDATGNATAFVGGRGGYATTGGARTGTSSFGAASKQALITVVLASLNEAFAPEDGTVTPQPRQQDRPQQALITVSSGGDDLPGTAAATIVDDDTQSLIALPTPTVRQDLLRDADEILTAAATTIVDEAQSAAALLPALPPVLRSAVADDEVATVVASFVDDDQQPQSFQALRPTPLTSPSVDEVIATAPTSVTVGGASDVQRSFQAAPQSGTLTTVALIPAWAILTAYVVDPTAGGINRVSNGGNLYQCSVAGTSASLAGGPSGTGTNITDGTAHWYYVGTVAGTDTAAGSQVLATVMRGNQTLVGSIDPTDNDSGSFTVITNNEYASFANSFAGVWRRSGASNIKTSYTVSATWGGSGGAGDELSVGWLELRGVAVGAPHAFSQVERASSSGGSVTAASITTTKRCLIVSYWFGNGTVQSQGAPDTATPAGGLTLIANATASLSLTPNGYVQHAVAWRMANPGTFSEVWTASPTDEGAQLVTIAYEDLSTQSITVDDIAGPLDPPRVVLDMPQRVFAVDELAGTVTIVDEDQPAPQAQTVRLSLVVGPQVGDELAITTVEDDVQPVFWPQLPLVSLQQSQIQEELASQVVDEDAAQPTTLGALRLVSAQAQADDELPPVQTLLDDGQPAAAVLGTPPALPDALQTNDEITTSVVVSQIEDEAPLPIVLRLAPPQPLIPAFTDELPTPVVVTMVDEDVGPQPTMLSALSPLPFQPQVDEIASSVVDDDSTPVQSLAALPSVVLYNAPSDDLPQSLALEDASWTFTPAWAPLPIAPQQDPGDDLPAPIAPGPIVEDDTLYPFPPGPLFPQPFQFSSTDEPVTGLQSGHVSIPGVNPDPEVYDGTVPLDDVYDGSLAPQAVF